MRRLSITISYQHGIVLRYLKSLHARSKVVLDVEVLSTQERVAVATQCNRRGRHQGIAVVQKDFVTIDLYSRHLVFEERVIKVEDRVLIGT